MPMYPARIVASISYAADRMTRHDLAAGHIVSERDYMSALSTRIRDAWLPVGSAYVYSKTLSGSVEQALGCDTLIIIHDDDGAKLCLIEAKWPRVATKPNYRWDKLQKLKGTSKPISHFSDQLTRQRQVLPDVFVAEMFLLESPPGTKSSLLDEYGATLVPHKSASNFDATRRQKNVPWSNQDFWELICFSRKKTMNLHSLMYGLASCSIGQPIPILKNEVAIAVNDTENLISIPTSIDRLRQMGPEICNRLGLSTLLVLQARWLGNY
ncbi:hypothetical protein [Castellaniella sp.]|uniref:hypothetical protein n=1 Tax=Castellaniella sp. TaxID=1955812 RepID=UPI002AFF9077|nr:hypothetical protein [Castellaniella sp.]